jgi:hypothetical protein
MSLGKEIPARLAFLVKVRENRKCVTKINDPNPDRGDEKLHAWMLEEK